MKNNSIFNSFVRLSNLPLDDSSVFETKNAALAYIERENTSAYVGQIIGVENDETTNASLRRDTTQLSKNSKVFIVAKNSNDELELREILDIEGIRKLIKYEAPIILAEVNPNHHTIVEVQDELTEKWSVEGDYSYSWLIDFDTKQPLVDSNGNELYKFETRLERLYYIIADPTDVNAPLQHIVNEMGNPLTAADFGIKNYARSFAFWNEREGRFIIQVNGGDGSPSQTVIKEIEELKKKIISLGNMGGYLPATSFNENIEDVQDFLTEYAIGSLRAIYKIYKDETPNYIKLASGDKLYIYNNTLYEDQGLSIPSSMNYTFSTSGVIITPRKQDIPNQTRVRNRDSGNTWIFNSGTQTWINNGKDFLIQADNQGSQGVVKGSLDKYKVSVNQDATMTVNGLQELDDELNKTADEYQRGRIRVWKDATEIWNMNTLFVERNNAIFDDETIVNGSSEIDLTTENVDTTPPDNNPGIEIIDINNESAEINIDQNAGGIVIE